MGGYIDPDDSDEYESTTSTEESEKSFFSETESETNYYSDTSDD